MAPFSYHSFLFPFKWEILSNKLSTSFEDKINLKELQKRLRLSTENIAGAKSWIRKTFVVDSHIGYNEYNYFYDFVRDVIYDVGEEESAFSPNNKSLVHHYEFLLPEGKNFYEIKCNRGENDTPEGEKTIYGREGSMDIVIYKLEIRKIFLNVYDSGVAVLSFNLLNFNYSTPWDILNINQFGRRAFVGGFQLEDYPSRMIKPLSSGSENKVDLAFSISLKFADGSEIKEDFENDPFKHNYVDLPRFISGLFAPNSITTDWLVKNGRNNLVWITPSIDDRM
ncbi:MAG: hypothetical protein LRY55_13265, partial [Leadbetterella sp.]|nr:hypothetical protein [Leadbetterella sp.]